MCESTRVFQVGQHTSQRVSCCSIIYRKEKLAKYLQTTVWEQRDLSRKKKTLNDLCLWRHDEFHFLKILISFMSKVHDINLRLT